MSRTDKLIGYTEGSEQMGARLSDTTQSVYVLLIRLIVKLHSPNNDYMQCVLYILCMCILPAYYSSPRTSGRLEGVVVGQGSLPTPFPCVFCVCAYRTFVPQVHVHTTK